MPRFGGVAKMVADIGGVPPRPPVEPPVKSKTPKKRLSSASAAATTTTKSDASKALSQLFVSPPATSSKVGTSSQIPISTAKAYPAAADKKHKTNKRPAESGINAKINKTESFKKLRSSGETKK